MFGDALLGAAIAFVIATLTVPVGLSGAVFLVPVQLSVLNTPSAAVSPTNLLYNLIAIPGALVRYRRTGNLTGPLARFLVLGTLPGIVIGAVVRVELLSGPDAFLLVVAAVLVPLGAWLIVSTPIRRRAAGEPALSRMLLGLAFLVGIVGGVYGIGGGSILAPVLLGMGFAGVEVAPAALVATFATSIAGIATFGVLSLRGDGSAPDWIVGLALGLGGLGGSYLGAALQPRLPEARLRRLAGVLAIGVGLRYVAVAAGM